MLHFVLALLPIAAILIGMAGFDLPSKVVAPACWLIAFLSGLLFFSGSASGLLETSGSGIVDGLRIVWIIFAAFTMLQVMLKAGAMDRIRNGLAHVTSDKRLMVLLLAIPFGTFLEGAAGAGSPAALAAPFLVGLGMNPVIAAAACLMGNSAPVSWGGAGVTTVVGAGKFVDFMQASAMTGRLACFEYILLPVLMIAFVFGRRAFRGIWRDILVLGLLTGAINFAISNVFIQITELTSLLGGFVSTLLYSTYLTLRREDLLAIPAEYRLEHTESQEAHSLGNFLFSLSPYFILCVLLVVVRLSVPLKYLIAFGGGYTVWVGCVILVSAVLASFIFRHAYYLVEAMKDSFKKVVPALLAMGFLLAMVNCMKLSGQISALAKTLSAAAGILYPMAAVLIGQIGGFITGTNLGSNLMFNPLHMEAVKTLALNPVTVVAAQNTGGAIGNMICPNNVVAVCACVAILGREGEVIRKTLMPSILLMLFLGLLAMFYTYVLFPI